MILPGLCSVTFRKLSPKEIISACTYAGLKAIEWGGDIHCPHGDIAVANSLRKACQDEGLATPSYGSYFRMDPLCQSPDFREVLDSALALGARTIRVWAGNRASEEMDSSYRSRLIDEIRRITSIAEGGGCCIGIEYHRNTAMDSNHAAWRLLEDVGHPAVKSYWQPREDTSIEQRLVGLEMVLPHLCHFHVFHWIGNPVERLPLAEAEAEWSSYLGAAKSSNMENVCAYLEFVCGDSIDAMQADAGTLLKLLKASR